VRQNIVNKIVDFPDALRDHPRETTPVRHRTVARVQEARMARTPRDKNGAGTSVAQGLAATVDDVCAAMLELPERAARPSTLRVNPQVYEAIARTKQREVGRGNPIVLLDLDVVMDADVEVDQPRLA
jgi:hypothetical protein